MKKWMFFLVPLLVCLAAAAAVTAAQKQIYVLTVADAISPGSAAHIVSGIETAEKEGAACLIIALDTPGGLADAMREIVMAIYASRVPVVVYVSPSGARAASAGVMITLAADIAAMAPGTNIGAAHPVGSGGQEIGETMSEKVTNDMVAYVRSIAEKRGRNVEWAEKAVRQSLSVTENEALEKGIINLIADDLTMLIEKIDGRKIAGKGTLDLTGAVVHPIEESFRTRVLRAISNPNIAYILMMIGLAGLYFELSHPGAVFPGVVGGIALILAFFSFQTLPVNYAGFLLIALSIIFFIMEMKMTSYGLLSVAGVVSLLLGSLMLFEGDGPYGRLSFQVLIPTSVLVSSFFVLVAALAFKAQIGRPQTGDQGLVGEIGVVKKALNPEGKVLVHGELWYARSDQVVAEGTRVQVTGMQRLVLTVEPVHQPLLKGDEI